VLVYGLLWLGLRIDGFSSDLKGVVRQILEGWELGLVSLRGCLLVDGSGLVICEKLFVAYAVRLAEGPARLEGVSYGGIASHRPGS
jgi:hypothetical protein